MSDNRHGISIGIDRLEEDFFLSIKVKGTLTHEDYEAVVPLIDSALSVIKKPMVNALIDGMELEGWDLRAAWDDFKVGLRHGSKFHKIAIIGNKKWQEFGAKIGGWFIAGEIRYYENESAAIAWLNK
jgi:hypothetical protein